MRLEPRRGMTGPSCRDLSAVVLARTATRTLACDDDAALEDLAAPDAPRLPTLQRAGEARKAGGAPVAERLGLFEFGRCLGEPEVCVLHAAGHVVRAFLGERVQRPLDGAWQRSERVEPDRVTRQD